MIPTQSAWLYPWPQTQQEPRTAKQIAASLVKAGMEAVFVKVADGGYHFDLTHYPTKGMSSTRWRQDVADFRAAGLQVYAWVYLYAANPDERDVAVSFMSTGLFDGLIVDVEGEFERSGDTSTSTKPERLANYLTGVRRVSKVLAYAPFWKPSVHTGLLYNEWNRSVDVAMPQAYWRLAQMSPGSMLDAMRADWARLSIPPKVLVPIGDPNSSAPAAEITTFGKTAIARYGRVSWWRWPFSSTGIAAMAALPDPAVLPPDTSTAGDSMGPFSVPETPQQVTLKEDPARPGNSVWMFTTDALVKDGHEVSLSPIRPLRLIGSTPAGVRIVAYEPASPDSNVSSTAMYVAATGIAKTEVIAAPAPAPDTTPYSEADVDAKVAAAVEPLNAQIVDLSAKVESLSADVASLAAIKGAWQTLTSALG